MKLKKESGQISGILIILAGVILVVIVVIFIVVRFAAKNPIFTKPAEEEQKAPELEYETTFQDTRFVFISAEDMGNVLYGQSDFFRNDLVTTEKFIKVTIGAQNKGKVNLAQYSWDVGNIVDSDGRNFVPLTNANEHLPKPDLCGALLKPEFAPTPCVKIYEVSKASTNLKITLMAMGQSSKKQGALIDILVK